MGGPLSTSRGFASGGQFLAFGRGQSYGGGSCEGGFTFGLPSSGGSSGTFPFEAPPMPSRGIDFDQDPAGHERTGFSVTAWGSFDS